jgi:hypothetical protein
MFKITIEETKTVKIVSGKEWAKIDTEEVERNRQWCSNENEPKTRIKDVMGYTPEIEKLVNVKREVLVQVVDDLDLAKVIKAINGLD